MTNRQFEIFSILSDNLSFARTAEELFLSQSSVTREIQALENELGFSLFRRSLKSVELTPEGIEFKRSITPIIKSLKTEISKIKNQNTRYKQSLRMGFFHTASLKQIPKAIGIFHKRFPDVLPEIHQANLTQLNAMFHAGQLDLIFAVRNIMAPSSKDQVMDLFPGRFCATIPVSNPLSEFDELTPSSFNGQDILQLTSNSTSSCLNAIYNEIALNCPDSHYIQCVTTEEQEVYLRAGIGVSISTDYSFFPDPAWKQIPIRSSYTDSIQSNYAVMWHKEHGANQLEEFIKVLKEVFEE